MWPRVDGMRAMELGAPGAMRDELNALVLAGAKRATTGLLDEYSEENESLEHVGERLALLDNEGLAVAALEITGVEVTAFDQVTWEHAAAEGEGDADLDAWRAVHRRFWSGEGTPVENDTLVVCLAFRLTDRPAVAASSA
ncbi:ASCH domain-containing protein [Streptomyces sp. NPDC056891]|uniref:ASCH domain-containing protein n=1 Tax=unclassified Streptomyces TaxID=2593676 RepID=UPI00369E43C9